MRTTRTITANEMRGINRSAVLDIIRREGPISRTQVAEELHISLPTVMRIAEELITEELVKPTGTKEWSGGRKRSLLEFNAHEHLTIGVDMGGSKIYGAVADMAGTILTETVSTRHNTKGTASYDLIVDMIEQLLGFARGTGHKIRGIGVGAPGITYYEEGVVQWAPSLDWRNFPLKEKLQNQFHMPVILDNDVNLAALGEMWFGVGVNLKNLVLITIGTGIGAGIVLDGAVYRGSHLTAGEIGFMLPDKSYLGSKREGFGSLESLASGVGIAERGRQALHGKWPNEKLAALTAEDVFKAYRSGEAWAQPVVLETIDYLAQMIVSVSVCLDPDVIVLSGGVSQAADLLIEPILKRIEGVTPIPPHLVSSHLGHRAAIMGAIINLLHNTSNFYVVHKLT
jgi:glucokinase